MSTENYDYIKDIYGEGKERWFKIKILNYEKALNNLKMYINGNKEAEEERGFEILSIGIRDEYVPQVSAMMDLKDEVLNYVSNLGLGDYTYEQINGIFKSKIEEVKSRTIVNKN